MRSEALPIAFFVPNPSIIAVTPTGGVGTTQSYKIVGIAADGTLTAASSAGTTAAGAATLDSTHYNTITWTDPLNAVSVQIWRTVGGAAQGLLGTVLAGVQTFRDNGVVASGTTPSAANGTGVGTSRPVSELSGLTAQFSGTFVATLQLQAKLDPGSWANVGAAQTAAALLDITATIKTASQVRVLMTAFTSGTPVVTVAGHFEGSSDIQAQIAAGTLPSQAGNSGKFLTTNGSVSSWGSAGGGTAVPKLFFSQVALGPVLVAAAQAPLVGGSYTLGSRFFVTRTGDSLAGLRFYCKTASKTIRCSLWDAAGTRLKTIDVVMTTAGAYTATFASAQALNPFVPYYIGIWATDASDSLVYASRSNYSTALTISGANNSPSNDATNLASGFMGGENFILDASTSHAGDAWPDSPDRTSIALVDPLFLAV